MEHKAQHHLQQAYLRGFSPHRFSPQARAWEKDQVWVYSKSKATIRMGSIPKLAFRPYQYSFKKADGSLSFTLEKGFADLESKFSAFLLRLGEMFHAAKTGGPAPELTLQDHSTLCEYVFTHIIRVPATLDWIRKGIESAGASVERDFGLPKNPDEDQRWTVYSLSNIGLKLGPRVFDLLMRKNVLIDFFPRTRTSIITSDHPVIRAGPPGGLVFPETQVLFPLDQRSFVTLHGVGTNHQLRNLRDLSVADHFNNMIINVATEEMYCADPNYLQNLLRRRGLEIEIVPPKTGPKER